LLILTIVIAGRPKILQYNETNWLYEYGLETHRYKITFTNVKSHDTIVEQQKRAERLSLVQFFDNNQRRLFIEICRQFQNENPDFYFDEDKKFHSTILGFDVIDSKFYKMITDKIKLFLEQNDAEMSIRFDVVRLGTKYESDNTLNPIKGTSNGTIIAFGDTIHNKRFTEFGNNLVYFLLNGKDSNSILGRKFRRRFPTVWCTMGYYVRDFKIKSNLESLFKKHVNLEGAFFQMPCGELELGKSCYKDLRDWKSIKRFHMGS
jgi:hypothetical protein